MLIPWLDLAALPELLFFVLISVAAELFLAIRLSQQRALSLTATFTFAVFLLFGAAAATLVQLCSWILSQLSQIFYPRMQTPSRIFIIFNAGQLSLCSLCGGLAVWLLFGVPLYQAPTEFVATLLVYALVYLVVNILLTSIAIWLRFSWTEVRQQLWPNVSLWTLMSFVICIPLALVVASFRNAIGFVLDITLMFAVLAVLSYIVRITLRLQLANRELKVLNEIGHNLAGSLALEDLFPSIYRSVQQLMPVDVFLVGLVDERHIEVELPFLVESDELLAPRTFALEGTLTDRVLRAGEPVFVGNLEFNASQMRFGRQDKHAAAVMFVPLSIGDRVIGVISAQSYATNVYTPHQLELLTSIGRIAAVAINNARLFAREKEVLRGREEFVSLVAHELKNPLAALLGHSQLLERRVRLADDKLRRPVGVIIEQGDRMNRLLEDLLDLSRADTGRLSLHIQRIDLGSLVKHVVDQQRALTSRHQLIVQSEAELPLINGDALRLTQVMQNLLTNAIKYSPNGGAITTTLSLHQPGDALWPRRLRKHVDTASRWIVVSIKDEGIGIPPDQLDHIFNRFYRARNTAQTNLGGTGLGLSVCEGLVKAHDGVIWAESEWEGGSTFSFALPVVPH
ncbi:MAG: GAF domain-containing protein [Chloroflexi bacterium]|nr:GAF domain-containing protein [Chloroflexota bacterium]